MITQLLWLVGRFEYVNRFNYTSLMAVVTPTDRPKSVCNRCKIDVVGESVLSVCLLEFSVGLRAFVI